MYEQVALLQKCTLMPTYSRVQRGLKLTCTATRATAKPDYQDRGGGGGDLFRTQATRRGYARTSSLVPQQKTPSTVRSRHQEPKLQVYAKERADEMYQVEPNSFACLSLLDSVVHLSVKIVECIPEGVVVGVAESREYLLSGADETTNFPSGGEFAWRASRGFSTASTSSVVRKPP